MFTHRLQDNSRWPNPIVLKITGAKPTFTPPRVETTTGTLDRSTRSAKLEATVRDLGRTAKLEVGFQYRSIVGLDASDRSIPWQDGPTATVTAPGAVSLSVSGLNPDGIYEFRAFARHPVLTVYGVEKRLAKR
jgi:alpha-L-fucosidase